eukprot:scaffold289755_cov22-Tisochrysis_lutea.AAC.1
MTRCSSILRALSLLALKKQSKSFLAWCSPTHHAKGTVCATTRCRPKKVVHASADAQPLERKCHFSKIHLASIEEQRQRCIARTSLRPPLLFHVWP